jgi:hypothetical protein
MRPIIELCLANVDLERAPRAALDDFLANRAPPPEGDKLTRRGPGGSRFASGEYHRRMRERERP